MSWYTDGFDDGKGEKFDELMVEINALREQLAEANKALGTLKIENTKMVWELTALRVKLEAADNRNTAMMKMGDRLIAEREGKNYTAKDKYSAVPEEKYTVTVIGGGGGSEVTVGWVGLTDKEFKKIMLNTYNIDLNVPGHSSDDHLLWAAIEAKLKEKNGG